MKKIKNNTEASLRCIWAGMISISIGILVGEYTSYSRNDTSNARQISVSITESAVTTAITSDVSIAVSTSLLETTLGSTSIATTSDNIAQISSTSDSSVTTVITSEPEVKSVTEAPVIIVPESKYEEPVTEAPVQTIVNSSTITEVTVEPIATEITSSEVQDTTALTYVKRFTRGTFYHTWGTPSNGGSGRFLLDCSYDNGDVRGSIASSYLYSNYTYNYNGNRTKVYLEVYDKHGRTDYSFMNGWYYVDDCDAWNPAVIDFYYTSTSNCPYQFQMDGVVEVECWI